MHTLVVLPVHTPILKLSSSHFIRKPPLNIPFLAPSWRNLEKHPLTNLFSSLPYVGEEDLKYVARRTCPFLASPKLWEVNKSWALLGANTPKLSPFYRDLAKVKTNQPYYLYMCHQDTMPTSAHTLMTLLHQFKTSRYSISNIAMMPPANIESHKKWERQVDF